MNAKTHVVTFLAERAAVHQAVIGSSLDPAANIDYAHELIHSLAGAK